MILLICNQFLASLHYISEEKIFKHIYVEPAQGVGLEGLTGLTIYTIVLPILCVIPAPGNWDKGGTYQGYLESVPYALYQITGNPILLTLVICTFFSIACFNVCGLSVTKYASATSRTTIDSVRTAVIWAFSLGLGWENFLYLQVQKITLNA